MKDNSLLLIILAIAAYFLFIKKSATGVSLPGVAGTTIGGTGAVLANQNQSVAASGQTVYSGGSNALVNVLTNTGVQDTLSNLVDNIFGSSDDSTD